MLVVSSVSSLRTHVPGYSSDAVINRLKSLEVELILLAEPLDSLDDLAYKLKKSTSFRVEDCSVDSIPYESFRKKFMLERANTPELSVKKNMLDLIDDTIYNYLASYWKDYDTVNSEVTDSLFRAKHKLSASVFYDLERNYWESLNSSIWNAIRQKQTGEKAAIICNVERRYWFLDQMAKSMPQL